MPQVRTITTSVAGPKFKEQGAAVEEFWRRMAASNGGRQGDPHDYAEIVDIYYDEGRGWVIEYEVPVELLEQREVRVIRDDPEPLEVPLIIKKPEPVYTEPPEGRVAHADKLKRSVDALVAKHKERKLSKCHVLSCMIPCIEGSSYCADHQTAEARADARGAPRTTERVDPVFETFDREEPVPVKDIMITGWNPRKAFDSEALQALAEDIRQNGLINAVTVRPKGKSKYEIVAGERRLRAFRLLGRATIPAKVRELTDEQMLDIMLAENLQRVDLNPIEEAHHLKRVLEVGKLTQTELGRRVGKSQEWVSQRLRLAEAPSALQDLIISRQINTSSAIEMLQWKNTEHFDEILREVQGWSSADEELPRATVRDIIRMITEPVAERLPREATPDISVAPTLYGEIAEPTDPPFVNPEDCNDCDIYDREKNECPELCTCLEECDYCFCEVTDDDEGGCEMFGVSGAADDEVCAVDCPDYEECKSEGDAEEDDDQDLPDEPEPVNDGLMITERPEDFVGNKGVPEVLGKHDSRGYHGRLIGSSNGDLQVETGDRKYPHLEDLCSEVAAAIGCAEGDVVPIAVDISRGAITIRRRGKF